MKKLTSLLLALGFAASMPLFSADKPDFTGKWTLNLEKSDFGKQEKPTKMTLDSQKKGDGMHSVQRISTSQGDDRTIESEWYPDGKEHSYDGPIPGTSVTHWRGDTLISESKSKDGKHKERTTLTMSSDGKSATEKIVVTGPPNEGTKTLVWDKQQ